jgi:hypothetical protein
LPEKLKNIGKNIIEGLLNGITEKWQNLWKTVTDFINGFTQGFKDALGIHSPSTLFAEIGKNIIQGLINGISSLINQVKDKFTNLKTNITNTVSDIKTNMVNAFNDAKTKVVDTFERIKNGISEKITNAKDAVRDTIDNIKGFFRFEWSLPSIKTPHIYWSSEPASGWIAKTLSALGLPSSIPKMNVNWYAQGGWLARNNPQLAVVGDNKREAEIIAPESKIRDQVKQAIREMGAAGQRFVMDLNLKIQTDDGRTIIKKINDVQVEDGYISLMI